MTTCVETIRICNGRVYNIRYHNARYLATIQSIYGKKPRRTNLRSLITPPEHLCKGEIKCRILYTDRVIKVTYQKYRSNPIKTVQIIHDDEISYPYKYTDRPQLDILKKRAGTDEIVIVKNGKVTDGYYYNLVFQRGDDFFTPMQNLLPGVMRRSLLDRRKIIETSISAEDIHSYDFVHFINAFHPLHRQIVSTADLLS